MDFTAPPAKDLPAPAQRLLRGTEQALGFLPNLMAVMALSPALLRAYDDLRRRFSHSVLSAVEQEVVLLTASVRNRCAYCVPVHTLSTLSTGVDSSVVESIRTGQAVADPRLQALRAFVESIMDRRGAPDVSVADRFAAAGYGPTHALAAVLGVVAKTLSNYTNQLTRPKIDEPLLSAAWKPSQADSARKAAAL